MNICLIRKGVYHQEYMLDWEKFTVTLPEKKKHFYSHLNMEDATDAN